MSMKLFVGGLNFETDNAGLRRGFESFGEIDDVAVISDRETGRSRGFGFVTFREESDGKKAMAAVDGQMLDGRTVRVNEATAKAPRRDGGGGGGYGAGGGGGYGGGGGGGYGGGGGGGYGASGGGYGGSGGGKGKSRRGERSDKW
jgi:cold-inducible RNA-binding protein